MTERREAERFYKENEARIRATLRVLSRQQCIGLLGDNVWHLQNSPPETEHLQQDMNTCFMRGWVEPLERAVPAWQASGSSNSPTIQDLGHRHFYRLTDSGWAVVNRSAPLAWLSLAISILSLVVALLSTGLSVAQSERTQAAIPETPQETRPQSPGK